MGKTRFGWMTAERKALHSSSSTPLIDEGARDQEAALTQRNAIDAQSGKTVIRAERLVKVFGPDPNLAVALMDQGYEKQEILIRTQCTIAVRRISFEVSRGEIFVIMGLSGSGKSTVVRLLNRLIEPTSGLVEIDGKNIQTLTARELRVLRNRKLSMVFQHFAIFPHLTVYQNVSYGLHVRRSHLPEQRARVNWALESVGLVGWDDAYPAELSGGMKQRVGLARALATDAEVMLMDEPFSALDPLNRREMQDLLIQLHRDLGRTIVFVTHDLNEAMRIGDRIMLMRDGEVVQLDTGPRILSAPANEYIEKFVADVDRARVLTAQDVMQQSVEVATLNDDLQNILCRINTNKGQPMYVVENGAVIGIVSGEQLDSAIRAGAAKLSVSMLNTDYEMIAPETPLINLSALFDRETPVLAVVDENRCLLGTVSNRAVLNAIGNKQIK